MNKPKRECLKPNCHNLTTSTYCEEHKKAPWTSKYPRLSSTARGYTAQWNSARKRFLSYNPFCVDCAKEGIKKLANVVDHIIPHRGNMKLFWSVDNWQGLCTYHHNSKTGRGE